MALRSARVLALVSASSTMLLGMSLLSAAAFSDAWLSPSIAAAPADFDTAAESGGEGVEVEEEREEEFGWKTHFFPGRSTVETLACRWHGSVGRDGTLVLPACWLRVVAIRGPPAA